MSFPRWCRIILHPDSRKLRALCRMVLVILHSKIACVYWCSLPKSVGSVEENQKKIFLEGRKCLVFLLFMLDISLVFSPIQTVSAFHLLPLCSFGLTIISRFQQLCYYRYKNITTIFETYLLDCFFILYDITYCNSIKYNY